MKDAFHINIDGASPIYKQLVSEVISGIRGGGLHEGSILPSMNSLSASLGISKETVKKAYAILRERGYIESRHGKGFYIRDQKDSGNLKVLVLFDKLSHYKEILFNEMVRSLGENCQVEIRLHNQSLQLLEYYLDEGLDEYDYYVITPHFLRDEYSSKEIMRQLGRIPNRKLLLLDHWIEDLPGNYGAVYQDFGQDIHDGLSEILPDLLDKGKINVISLSASLYHGVIESSVKRFCDENSIRMESYTRVEPSLIHKGEVYLMLNSQLDSSLLDFVRECERRKMEIGRDIFIIFYNESPIYELVLGGLTTVSTDFAMMGRMAAWQILSGKFLKQRCPFKVTRRKTF